MIDTLTVPYRDLNPYKTPMRIGGVGVLSDGDCRVHNHGDVWIVSGVNDKLDRWYGKGLPPGSISHLVSL